MHLLLDRYDFEGGARSVVLYAQFWLLNKTQLPLYFSRIVTATTLKVLSSLQGVTALFSWLHTSLRQSYLCPP